MGMFATSDMLVSVQLAMYIWHDPVFVFHGVPLTAPSSATSS
jgi:hypothetical protein